MVISTCDPVKSSLVEVILTSYSVKNPTVLATPMWPTLNNTLLCELSPVQLVCAKEAVVVNKPATRVKMIFFIVCFVVIGYKYM